jgi:hypothetical protein
LNDGEEEGERVTMSKRAAEPIVIHDSMQYVAEELKLLSVKMQSVVQAMDEPAKKDPHLAGLVGVMDDLVSDLEEVVLRAGALGATDSAKRLAA